MEERGNGKRRFGEKGIGHKEGEKEGEMENMGEMKRFDGREWEEVSVTDCRISSMCLVKKEHISAIKSRKSNPRPLLMMTGVLAALTGLILGAIAWWNSY